MRTLVMKFGGSSIGMTTGLAQMVRVMLHERERWERIILVVSALEGVTDSLLDAAQLAHLSNQRGYRRIVANLRTRHLALIQHLQIHAADQTSLQAELDRLLYEIMDHCQALADGARDVAHEESLVDAIVGAGERLAARIVAALLRHHQLRSVAVDATDLILSNAVHGHATPDFAASREQSRAVLLPLLERQIVPVVTGFIATGTDGQPTTLGRGGSDLTAAVLATSLDADEVWLWTDVDGLMSADPHQLPSARPIADLSFPEAAELSFFGARILHTRMVQPLAERRIGLRVRNIYRPRIAGTRVHGETAHGAALKSVTTTHALGLFAPSSGLLVEAMRCVDQALDELTGSHIEAILTAQSAGQSVTCFVIPFSAGPDALHSLLRLAHTRLPCHPNGDWQLRPVGVATVVGAMYDSQPGALSAALGVLSDLPVLAISPNPSRASLSLAVELHDLPTALARLHDLILSEGGKG